MAGPFRQQRKAALRQVTPEDHHVHQGAILHLPRKDIIDRKYGNNHVKTVDRVKKVNGMDASGAYTHPILVLSRPDESTIEFITLRSYGNTALEDVWPLFSDKTLRRRVRELLTPREIVEHHLSIFPAHHPLHTLEKDKAYQVLRLLDDLKMRVNSHVCVYPILTMDWRATNRWFHPDKPDDTTSHRRLDEISMNAVLSLAEKKVRYVPGNQYQSPWTRVPRRR